MGLKLPARVLIPVKGEGDPSHHRREGILKVAPVSGR
jgi:hypothetical protein